jgi:hypothetical protein
MTALPIGDQISLAGHVAIPVILAAVMLTTAQVQRSHLNPQT